MWALIESNRRTLKNNVMPCLPLFLRIGVACLLSTAVFGLSGCGSGGVPLGTVTGRITKNGTPQPKLSVFLTPEEHGRPSEGLTDSDGHYFMVYTRDAMGALVGRHRLSISTQPKFQHEMLVATGAELFSKEVEVTSGSNVFDIDLADGGGQKAK